MASSTTLHVQLQAAQTHAAARKVNIRAFTPSLNSKKPSVLETFAVRPALASSRSAVVVRAVAEAKTPAASQTETQEWYAVVASADFFFNDVQNEPFAEQLREKKRWLDEQGKECDFYIVPQPAWLEEKFPAEAKRVRKPAVALISTDKVYITFMKLRLDRVLKLELGSMSIDGATKSNGPVPEFPPPKDWIAPYAPYAPGWWKVFERK